MIEIGHSYGERVLTWEGRPLAELTKEELIEAINFAVDQLQDARDSFHKLVVLFRGNE